MDSKVNEPTKFRFAPAALRHSHSMTFEQRTAFACWHVHAGADIFHLGVLQIVLYHLVLLCNPGAQLLLSTFGAFHIFQYFSASNSRTQFGSNLLAYSRKSSII